MRKLLKTIRICLVLITSMTIGTVWAVDYAKKSTWAIGTDVGVGLSLDNADLSLSKNYRLQYFYSDNMHIGTRPSLHHNMIKSSFSLLSDLSVGYTIPLFENLYMDFSLASNTENFGKIFVQQFSFVSSLIGQLVNYTVTDGLVHYISSLQFKSQKDIFSLHIIYTDGYGSAKLSDLSSNLGMGMGFTTYFDF